MSLLEKVVFIAAHEIQRPGFLSLYEHVMRNQWKSREAHLHDQTMSLRRMVRFCYDRVPFYRRHFKEASLTPSDIRNQSDLEKVPPIDKPDIIQNKADFLPVGLKTKYGVYHTGGTTGTFMDYHVSHQDRFLSGALLYRGWSAAGYGLGDRLMILGGGSLVPTGQSVVRAKMNELTRNTRLCSAFKMGSEDLKRYLGLMNSWKPSFLRGYPSALKEFADFIEDRGLVVPRLKGILTTSEKLYPSVRRRVENVFQTRIFDGYGANDGGISAHERECGNLHIDTERSIMEIVDKDNNQIENGTGRVLATNLTNFAMPLLRYELGDEVVATDEVCSCGRGLPMLKEIIGRTVAVLVTPSGSLIHGWFLHHNWEFGEKVKQYKIVQESVRTVKVYLVPGPGFGSHIVRRIRTLVSASCSEWNLEVNIVESIPKSRSGKVIFIESKVKVDGS